MSATGPPTTTTTSSSSSTAQTHTSSPMITEATNTTSSAPSSSSSSSSPMVTEPTSASSSSPVSSSPSSMATETTTTTTPAPLNPPTETIATSTTPRGSDSPVPDSGEITTTTASDRTLPPDRRSLLIKYLDQKAPPQEKLVFKQKELREDVWDSLTIGELKKIFEPKLKPKPGWNAERIFVYKGRILKRDQRIGELKLNDKSFLICILKRLTPIVEEKKQVEAEPVAAAVPTPTAASARGARGAPPPQQQQQQQQNQNFNEELVTNLMAIGGFPRDMVLACLQAAFGNADRAAEYLFNGIPENRAPRGGPSRSPTPSSTTTTSTSTTATTSTTTSRSTSSAPVSSASASSATPTPHALGQRAWNEFQVTDTIDAQDQSDQWYEANVLEVKDDSILVHYSGWSSRWDEWLPRSSSRLAPRGSRSTPSGSVESQTAAAQTSAATTTGTRRTFTATRTVNRSTTTTNTTTASSTTSSSQTPASMAADVRAAFASLGPPTATATSDTRSGTATPPNPWATIALSTTSAASTTSSSATPAMFSVGVSSPSTSRSAPRSPTPSQMSLPPSSSTATPASVFSSSTTSASTTPATPFTPFVFSPATSTTPLPSTSSGYQAREAQRPAADLNAQIAVRLQAVEEQVREAMLRAFFDTLEQKLASNPPDYEWVIRLYVEIRERIGSLTPHRQDFQAELKEQMDDDLFAQMLRNNAYDATQLRNLVHFTFGRIEALEAPARNTSTRAILASLDQEMQKPTCTFATFVPLFLRHVHTKLDEIEQDIRRLQTMVQRANSPGSL